VLVVALRIPFHPDQRAAVLYLTVLLIAFSLLISVVLYLYVALSGGVMGREERHRRTSEDAWQ
jgi:Na+/melibiose symporter-like transporter